MQRSDYVVEQGPRWLADIFINPTSTTQLALGLAYVLVIVVIGVRFWQLRPLSMERKQSLVGTIAMVTLIECSTWGLVQTNQFSYLLDVTGGTSIGVFAYFIIKRNTNDYQDVVLTLENT